MDIIELLNVKTKKDLLELLKKHSIKYKKRFGEISFKANINTYDFTIYTYIQGKSVNTFRIVMDNKKYDYDVMVQNMLALKDNFVSLFGKPKMDLSEYLDFLPSRISSAGNIVDYQWCFCRAGYQSHQAQ